MLDFEYLSLVLFVIDPEVEEHQSDQKAWTSNFKELSSAFWKLVLCQIEDEKDEQKEIIAEGEEYV